MEEKVFKSKIKEIAVDHFDQNGYHGTTIRHIANEAGCSLPMIYYYYKSKRELFHEIIEKDYFELLNRQAQRVEAADIIDFYTDFVFELNHLSSYDKKIYRLGVKVYLGFDGDIELMELMDQWEKSIVTRHTQLVFPHLIQQSGGEIIVRALIHMVENMIESIVVKNRFLARDKIKEELSVILADRIK